jgi:hypothetical protein
MFELYKELINKQNRTNQTLLEQSSNATHDEYLKRGVGVSLSYRSAESVFNRFKSQISPEVMKYMGITETTDMASGWSMDDHKMACLEIYKQRYGNAFDFYSCYEYLKTRRSSQRSGLNARRTALERDQLGRKRQGRPKLMQRLSRQLSLKSL